MPIERQVTLSGIVEEKLDPVNPGEILPYQFAGYVVLTHCYELDNGGATWLFKEEQIAQFIQEDGSYDLETLLSKGKLSVGKNEYKKIKLVGKGIEKKLELRHTPGI